MEVRAWEREARKVSFEGEEGRLIHVNEHLENYQKKNRFISFYS